MTATLSLDKLSEDALRQLRDPDSGMHDLLVQLVTTNCLLELAKLASAKLTLDEFAGATLNVLSTFSAVDNWALRIEAPDLPPVGGSIGRTTMVADEGESRELTCVAATLKADDNSVGHLSAFDYHDLAGRSDLVDRVAEQVSSGLSSILEAERLRRQLAAARVIEIVAGLDESYSHQELADFAGALAALPNATGAKLSLANPRFGGPLTVRSGQFDANAAHTERTASIDGRVQISLAVSWLAPNPSVATVCEDAIASFLTAVERIEQALRLREEVETDELTRIGNRRRALRALSASRAWAEREERHVSVLLADLDHFKRVNDQLGHDVGDQLLLAIASAFSNSIREYDTAARWGGEEFMIICPDTNAEEAAGLANRLLAIVPTAAAAVLPDDWAQTISIGIATYPQAGDNPTVLVKSADTALYAAKGSGRNRYVIAAPAPAAR